MTQTELDDFVGGIFLGESAWVYLNPDELVWVFRQELGTTVYYCRFSGLGTDRNLYSEFACGPDDFLDKLTLWKLAN